MIPALDTDDLSQALSWVDLLAGEGPRIFKVGAQLFTHYGPQAVREILARGAGVFLDLKFCDIPNTVAQAARAAAALGVQMFNVHACGGSKMMKAAVEAAKEESTVKGQEPPVVLGVTVLTSMGQEDMEELGLTGSLTEWVLKWAELAWECGLRGLVASPREASLLRSKFGKGLILVCPGIRRTGAGGKDDQRRFLAPDAALKDGADYIVMGRSLWESEDPLELIRQIERTHQKDSSKGGF